MKIGLVFGFIASFLLAPMSIIRFYESAWHFVCAVLLFVFLAVAQLCDSLVMMGILRHVNGGILSLKGALLCAWNVLCSLGGLLCFLAWISFQATLLEWVAATLPFLFFLPWIAQVDWLLLNLSDQQWDMTTTTNLEHVQLMEKFGARD